MKKKLLICLISLLTLSLVHAQDKLRYYPLPDTTSLIGNDFSFLYPTTPLLAYKGGLLLPELGCWLIPPEREKVILSAVMNFSGHLYVLALAGRNLILEKRTIQTDSSVRIQRLHEFGKGFYTISLAENRKDVYLFGGDQHGSIIYKLNADDQAQRLFSVPGERIRSMYCDAGNEILYVAGNTIWRYNGSEKTKLMEFPDKIEGITVAKNQGVFISTINGTVIIKPSGDISLIHRSIHGPLHYRENRLYILSLEQNSMVSMPLTNSFRP